MDGIGCYLHGCDFGAETRGHDIQPRSFGKRESQEMYVYDILTLTIQHSAY